MAYETPELIELGRLSELTLGNGGTSCDGDATRTQRGGGNDSTGPKDCED